MDEGLWLLVVFLVVCAAGRMFGFFLSQMIESALEKRWDSMLNKERRSQ